MKEATDFADQGLRYGQGT